MLNKFKQKTTHLMCVAILVIRLLICNVEEIDIIDEIDNSEKGVMNECNRDKQH